jgi:hypothetical protein
MEDKELQATLIAKLGQEVGQAAYEKIMSIRNKK